MPVYEFFCDETGQRASILLPFSEAPVIGSTRVHNGNTFRRVPPNFEPAVAPEYNFISHQVDDWHPEAPHHLPDGTAAFTCKNEVDEFCRKTQDSKYLRFFKDGRNVPQFRSHR